MGKFFIHWYKWLRTKLAVNQLFLLFFIYLRFLFRVEFIILWRLLFYNTTAWTLRLFVFYHFALAFEEKILRATEVGFYILFFIRIQLLILRFISYFLSCFFSFTSLISAIKLGLNRFARIDGFRCYLIIPLVLALMRCPLITTSHCATIAHHWLLLRQNFTNALVLALGQPTLEDLWAEGTLELCLTHSVQEGKFWLFRRCRYSSHN